MDVIIPSMIIIIALMTVSSFILLRLRKPPLSVPKPEVRRPCSLCFTVIFSRWASNHFRFPHLPIDLESDARSTGTSSQVPISEPRQAQKTQENRLRNSVFYHNHHRHDHYDCIIAFMIVSSRSLQWTGLCSIFFGGATEKSD